MKKLSLKLWAVLAVLLGLPAEMWAADDDRGYYFMVGECHYVVTENSSTVKEVALTSCDISGNPTTVTIPEKVTHPTTGTEFTVAYITPSRMYLQSGYNVSPVAYNGTNYTAAKLTPVSSSAGPFSALNSSLTTINLPKTIKSITKNKYRGVASDADDESASMNILFGLSKAVTVIVDSDNPYIKVHDGVLYTEDGKRLLLYPTCLTATSYTVRSGTEAIAASAFNRGEFQKLSAHDYLTTIILPPSIRTIENNVFYENRKLSSINIPTLQNLIDAGDADASGIITRGVTIGEQAFFRTSALERITLPNSITRIGKTAFSEGGLTSVEVPGSVETIEENVFKNCKQMTTAVLNEGTKYIKLETFAGCKNMTSVTLPEGLLTIEKQSLAFCSKLPSITIPSTVTSIGDYAFVSNSVMTSINIPAVAVLGKGVFTLCDNLENITVDGGTRYQMDYDSGKLDKGVLYGNSNNVLNTKDELVFFIPKNKIGASNTDLIRQWAMPLSVKKICAGSIGMTALESLVLPSELTTIEELAFFRFGSGNENKDIYIKELTIPAKVTNLHFSAFYQPGGGNYFNISSYTTRFEKIYFMGTPTISHTNTNLTIYKLNDNVALSTSIAGTNLSYMGQSSDKLAFYVKNSNLSNSVFNTAKNRVKTFSAEIPVPRLTEKGKIITMCRDFDVDFSNATGMKAYIATGYDEANKGVKMREILYVPSRTGTNNNGYLGFVVVQTEDEAGTYRIGEKDYNSGSQRDKFLSTVNTLLSAGNSRLRHVVVNSHIQGSIDGVNTWGLSNGKWQRIVNTGKLTPYDRAYLLPTAEDNAKMLAAIGAATGNNAKVKMIFLDGDSEVTGITTITEETSGATGDDWYTINGQRLTERPTAKGIYIHNGRKEVIR
ncbi:MAG: leucine-rich repeat domain-containing protein [Prevotella sp.]|nr:leucine-rich repeat domain-containing protein [Prevotella sp.]